MFRVFKPILAGATLRERMIACVGAVIGICLTSLVCGGQHPRNAGSPPAAARRLPDAGQLVGTVGLRELMKADGELGPWISKGVTASADDPAISLLPALIDGSSHAVVIVDAERRVQGLITQSDLLAAMMRTLARRAA